MPDDPIDGGDPLARHTDRETEVTSEERNFAVLSHLGAFAGYMIPFGHVAAPLLVWLFKSGDSAYIEHHARESLNFQISITLYAIAAGLLAILFVGFVLFGLIVIFDVVMVLVAAVRASRGERYRYPACIRLIS